jgi:hypothetical protein
VATLFLSGAREARGTENEEIKAFLTDFLTTKLISCWISFKVENFNAIRFLGSS